MDVKDVSSIQAKDSKGSCVEILELYILRHLLPAMKDNV